MKTNRYQKALLKKIAPLDKFNRLAHVFVLMQAPFMSPTGFPREMVPADKIAERLANEWIFVLKEPKDAKKSVND